MIDNTGKLKDFISFEPNKYYKFVVLLREKDGKTILKSYDKKEIIVRQWLIDSQEKLDEMLPDMITFAELFRGRLYVTVDRKDVSKTLFQIKDRTNEYIKQMFFGNRTEISTKQLNKLIASTTSMAESSDKKKVWLFDIDTKSIPVKKYVETLCGEYYLTTMETPNGYHVLAERKFNAISKMEEYNNYAFETGQQMTFLDKHNKPVVDLKDNALTLVYYKGE
jgi:hypothetical protein